MFHDILIYQYFAGMSELDLLVKEYQELLCRQCFDENDLDYSILEKHKEVLNQLSKVGNSGITVFDLNRQEHVFTSYNFQDLFGFDLDKIEAQGTEYFNSRIHPDDFQALIKAAIAVLRFYYEAPVEGKRNYKMINEYRVLNAENNYVRVIEQHQILELDKSGNAWLALAVIDISPDQKDYQGIKSQMLNYKTGQIHALDLPVEKKAQALNGDLTKREKEILYLIKDGYLSKEISDKLCISIHTVNTHRQRILEKLNADNSIEAVSLASNLGLLK